MKIGETILIRPKDQPATPPATAEVSWIDAEEIGIRANIEQPPEWLRQQERKRGLFSNGPATLLLFRAHDGAWVNTQTLEPYDIQPA